MFFFLTWYVKRTPYVVLILMFSRSSGLFRSVSHPVRLRQHSRHAFSLLPTFSFSHLLPLSFSHFLTFSSSPFLALKSSHFLHNHISLLYLFLFKNKII